MPPAHAAAACRSPRALAAARLAAVPGARVARHARHHGATRAPAHPALTLLARAPPGGRKAGGTLTFLGADLREHGYFFSCDCYALLEGEGPARVVRLTSSAYKVNVVTGPDLWCCLPDSAGDLLRGVSQHLTFK